VGELSTEAKKQHGFYRIDIPTYCYFKAVAFDILRNDGMWWT